MNRQLKLLWDAASNKRTDAGGVVWVYTIDKTAANFASLLVQEFEKTCDELTGRRIGEVDPIMILKGKLGIK